MSAKRPGWEDWGLRFRVQCRERGLSTKQVADKLGMHEASVRSWLNGHRAINLSDFFRLCDAAGIDPASTLFAGQVDPQFLSVGRIWTQIDQRGKDLISAVAETARRMSAAGGDKAGSPRR